jgi:hypothetical protein
VFTIARRDRIQPRRSTLRRTTGAPSS